MKGKKAVQSKFPTARIKKIMQADEDVGKIAQSTPIVVSRALELFLRDVVTEACGVVRQGPGGGKKVLPYHVKRLVAQNRQYDFLDDLVQQIVDPTAGIGGGGGMAGAGAGQSMAAGGSKQAVGSKIGGGGGVASSLAPPAKEEEEEEEDDDEEEY